jgi:hypothetical protein
MLTTIVLYGVLIPAAITAIAFLLAAFALPDRFRAFGTNAAVALGGLGTALAFSKLTATPDWPVTDTVHWLYFAALFAVGAGFWDAGFRSMQDGPTRWVRLVPAFIAAWMMPPALFSSLIEHTWDAAEASSWLWAGRFAVLSLWLGLDQAVERAGGFGGAVILTVFATGASVAVVLGSFALGAQTIGAAAASIGSVATAFVLVRKKSNLSVGAAIPLVVMVSLAGLSAAFHYATLSRNAVVFVVLAPLIAAAVGFLPKLKPLVRGGAQVVALVAALAVAGFVAERPAGESDAAGDDPYDYGYGYDESPATDEPAPADDADPYSDYGNLKGWTPPSQDATP